MVRRICESHSIEVAASFSAAHDDGLLQEIHAEEAHARKAENDIDELLLSREANRMRWCF